MSNDQEIPSGVGNCIYIILCGGDNKRWGNYLGIKKHYLPICNEGLVFRTIRLIREMDVTSSIFVVTQESERATFQETYAQVYISPEFLRVNNESDKFLSSRLLWNAKGKTVILFGDVWYSHKGLKKILSYSAKKWKVFGRQKASRYTGCNHGELFAWCFWPEHHNIYLEKLEELNNLYQDTALKIASGWGHYNLISNLNFLMDKGTVIKGYALFSNFCHIDDFTDDFDYPADYHRWLKHVNYWKKKSRIFKFTFNSIESLRHTLLLINNLLFELKLKVLHPF